MSIARVGPLLPKVITGKETFIYMCNFWYVVEKQI